MFPESVVIEWRPIPDWETYEVSSDGRVRRAIAGGNRPAGYMLRPKMDKDGYVCYSLFNGRPPIKMRRVSRLMLLAFVGEPPTAKHQAAHNDGNPTNNTIANLRWATQSENFSDKWKHGTMAWGEDKPAAKLTHKQVAKIRIERAQGKTLVQLAKAYGVSHPAIGRIVRGTGWIDKAAA
jgi:NUMOD4 motif/HNH endonuclease